LLLLSDLDGHSFILLSDFDGYSSLLISDLDGYSSSSFLTLMAAFLPFYLDGYFWLFLATPSSSPLTLMDTPSSSFLTLMATPSYSSLTLMAALLAAPFFLLSGYHGFSVFYFLTFEPLRSFIYRSSFFPTFLYFRFSLF
jgi:hypothetical protein